ncbi:MAG TPA: acyl-CoA dehydrogenase N-terminal domain-containing protein, partial [Burkholderiaceae bacterium]|nr:acyl-CoA dehydrogenase N-terminal domain-containing protein [Burkholderiaceae bacterium]
MPQYNPPIRDMQFVLHELLDVETQLAELPPYAEYGPDLFDQVLEEGGRFCAEVLFPLNRSGDEEGCRHEGDGVVRTPAGFKDAWDKFREAGWPTLTCDPEYGGQGLPYAVGMAFQEMLNSANQAWA